jgi:hypothetical protein
MLPRVPIVKMWLVKNELEGIRKEMASAEFDVLSGHSPGGPEENHEMLQSRYPISRQKSKYDSPNYKAWSLPLGRHTSIRRRSWLDWNGDDIYGAVVTQFLALLCSTVQQQRMLKTLDSSQGDPDPPPPGDRVTTYAIVALPAWNFSLSLA